MTLPAWRRTAKHAMDLDDDGHDAYTAGGAHPDLASHNTLGLATQAELDTHEGAANPHPGYLTPAEGDAAYSALAHGHTLDFGEVGDIVASAFGDTAAAGATGEIADAAHRHAREANPITAHEAAGDPHPTYLTAAEGNAAYQPLDSDLTAIAALATTAFGRGLLALADAAALAANHTHSGASTAYAPGSFTVATGNYAVMSKTLQLTSSERVTLQGTARLRIT